MIQITFDTFRQFQAHSIQQLLTPPSHISSLLWGPLAGEVHYAVTPSFSDTGERILWYCEAQLITFCPKQWISYLLESTNSTWNNENNRTFSELTDTWGLDKLQYITTNSHNCYSFYFCSLLCTLYHTLKLNCFLLSLREVVRRKK